MEAGLVTRRALVSTRESPKENDSDSGRSVERRRWLRRTCSRRWRHRPPAKLHSHPASTTMNCPD
eukprot:5375724-Lingulodinium_polyedra.AAC.1